MHELTKEQKNNIQKLIDTLRSGKYKQGKNQLKFDDKYCCLGVACDISGLGEWNNNYYTVGQGKTYNIFLPSVVKDFYGFNHSNPRVKLTGKELKRLSKFSSLYTENTNADDSSVSYLNDHEFTFNEIADILERTYLE